SRTWRDGWMSLNRRLDAIEKRLGPADRGPVVARLRSIAGTPAFTRDGLCEWVRDTAPGFCPDRARGLIAAAYLQAAAREDDRLGGRPGPEDRKDLVLGAGERGALEMDALIVARGIEAAETELAALFEADRATHEVPETWRPWSG